MRKCVLLMALAAISAGAETPLVYEGTVSGNAGSGDFAPSYMMSGNGGVLTQPKAFSLQLKAEKELDLSRRFSYAFGVEGIAGHASAFEQYDQAPQTPTAQGQHPTSVWLQQLYGEVKYRGVFLSVGMKERTSPLLNDKLGSGDYVQSNNARPVPQIRAGFVDFQNIPFTNGWVQIQGEIAYGKYMQNGWLEDHFNFYNGKYNLNEYFNYKRCYFRTKPSQPFSVTVGMQMVTEFGGTAYEYEKGKLKNVDPYDVTFKDVWKAFLPSEGGSNPGDAAYYYGNTLGSWDFVARYRLKDETELKAYFQWPFEDGSGIGKLNGFDGIWGLEYKSSDKNAIVSGAVVEYIDFTNQAGPMHWAPHDHPGTEYTDQATGGDNYYNNFRCNSYMNFGMSQGSPFIPATIYNRLGNGKVRDNRIRGFHVGVSGNAWAPLEYRLMFSYRKSWGTYSVPRLATIDDVSLMVEGIYSFKQVEGLSVKGQIAFDRGDLLGDNFGVLLSVNYKGLLNLFGK
ncbi:MAG TPA: hypothetical protein IAD18_08395 [Candidatus Limisoma intestinavium]|uniref:Capsule assembly protein Wzi n=1 Tax=Candidatus Limisoma intestinavium TaxID=2840856 RepID=A0A9D1ILR0_9BACT|nr:hypothetical protein [Candidatus Limisoma intestinavium]